MALRLVTSKITKSSCMGSASCTFMSTDSIIIEITPNSVSNWKNSSSDCAKPTLPQHHATHSELRFSSQHKAAGQLSTSSSGSGCRGFLFSSVMLENAGLYKFYILGSICTHVFRDPNSQLFPASDTKGMRGKFDFCAFSRTVGFHKDCTIKYIQYVVHRHGETPRPLAAMLEIPLGHQLVSTIFLGLLPPAPF